MEEKCLEYAKYEARQDAREEIIEMQNQIFEAKKKRHSAARQEVYRWDELRTELRKKIKQHKQSTKKVAMFSEEEEKKNDDDDCSEDEVQSSPDEESDNDDEPHSYDYADEPSNKGIAKLADDNDMDTDDDDEDSDA